MKIRHEESSKTLNLEYEQQDEAYDEIEFTSDLDNEEKKISMEQDSDLDECVMTLAGKANNNTGHS